MSLRSALCCIARRLPSSSRPRTDLSWSAFSGRSRRAWGRPRASASPRIHGAQPSASGSRRTTMVVKANDTKHAMEVEIKFRLASKEDRDKVHELFRNGAGDTHEQENYFFDGARGELSSTRTVLRVRIYGGTEKATLTLKGKAAVVDGVSRAMELESKIDPEVAHRCVAEPNTILEIPGQVLDAVREKGVEQLVGLGGFANTRQELRWESLLLELDETRFEWGTVYELECETDQLEVVKPRLEAALRGAGIAFRDGTVTKFANFVNKTLD